MKTTTKKAKLFQPKLFAMDLARLVCWPMLLIFRIKRLTPEGTPYKGKLQGGAVIAANHTSFEDPFLVGTTFWYRRMFFLVAEVVMKGKVRSFLLRGAGAIRVDRNAADIESMRKSVEVLKQGHVLTIFPQGGIVEEEGVSAIKSGAVLMALQAGVPIVPMHICKRRHWYDRRRVVIGNVVDPRAYITKKFPTTADIEAVTKVLFDEMSRCVLHE